MFYRCYTVLKKAAAVSVCCFFLYACENDIKDIKALTQKKVSVEEAIKVDGYLSEQAKVKARLTAPLMKRYQTDSPYVEFPNTLHVDFYNDSLQIESRLDAHYGRYIESVNRVFLKDSVVIFNLKGDTLHCRELWWDQQSQKFYTDKPVRIHQPDKILYGEGLEAAQNFSWWILKSARGPVKVPKEGLP